jgi:diguanylate cyclase (GGDEF)-like protein
LRFVPCNKFAAGGRLLQEFNVAFPSGAKPIRVLVVEAIDPKRPASLYSFLQEKNNFDIVCAASLREALVCLEQSPFEVILLDLSLPDSSGLRTFSQVSSHTPEVPVVVASWQEDLPLALELLREGAQDYLIRAELDANRLRRALQYAIERHRSRAMLHQLTFNDELTGLLNRRGFLSLARQHLKIAQRENWELALVFADLDRLKNINDTFGHPEGDRALRSVANILKETFRTSDLIARLGGDEFIILAMNAPASGVRAITNRLYENLARYNSQSRYYQLSLSFGIVQFDPQREDSLEELILKADQALYEDKRKRIHLSP